MKELFSAKQLTEILNIRLEGGEVVKGAMLRWDTNIIEFVEEQNFRDMSSFIGTRRGGYKEWIYIK